MQNQLSEIRLLINNLHILCVISQGQICVSALWNHLRCAAVMETLNKRAGVHRDVNFTGYNRF